MAISTKTAKKVAGNATFFIANTIKILYTQHIEYIE